MKKVLLAIDGMTPDRKAFRYAVALCNRISAELSIFQIIRPQYYREYKKKIRKKGLLARKFFEGSMVAATFAEAGEHETALDIKAETSKEIRRLLQESEEAGVHCHFSMKSGNPEQEIVNYVNDHRNVVLTIYDVSDHDVNEANNISRKKNALAKITKGLSVPLVMVQN
ncbi:MAG: universal stress protein [Desulfobacterales bacterium]